MAIMDGVAKLAAHQSVSGINSDQRTNIFRRLDSLLLSTRLLSTDDTRNVCLQLPYMSHTDRVSYISQYFGEITLSKAHILLEQARLTDPVEVKPVELVEEPIVKEPIVEEPLVEEPVEEPIVKAKPKAKTKQKIKPTMKATEDIKPSVPVISEDHVNTSDDDLAE